MRTTYRVLASLVALAVGVQAAAIAFAHAGLYAWIQTGGVLDKAAMESESSGFYGDLGVGVHSTNGYLVIPVLALALLVVAFFARIPRGTVWAGVLLLLIVVQIMLGGLSLGAPSLGILHGLNALAVFTVAQQAAARARVARTADVAERAPATGARVG